MSSTQEKYFSETLLTKEWKNEKY